MLTTPRAPARPRSAARSLAAVALTLAVGLVGCGDGGGATTEGAGAATTSGLPAGTVLIDVRTPEEFATGHLEGALNLPVELAGFAEAVADLDPDAEYLVYCRSGRRADVAIEYMTGLGLRARNLGSVAEASAETGVRVVE